MNREYNDKTDLELILEDLRSGKPIILIDEKDREDEGDFIIAAQFVTPEQVTFLTRQASGIISVAMAPAVLDRLGIRLMVEDNRESMRTAFTVTVDARVGISTGSSAFDRALTMQRLASPNSTREDFVCPGHVNPIRARERGILERPGHTEAAVDLMRLAGLQPVAVISEIMNDKGKMSRYAELEELAMSFNLKLITMSELLTILRSEEN
jgi:3,4-dihydroxy 2-butanone 4-phosphate synthase/GTP cyclohydrolase II